MIEARVRRLEVRGFRRFQEPRTFTLDSDVEDHPVPTLVIAGPNGSGKSSFFEALLYGVGREDLLHREIGSNDRVRWLDEALASDAEVKLTLDVTSAPGTSIGPRTPCDIEIVRSRRRWTIQTVSQGKSTGVADKETTIRDLLDQLSVEWFSSWRHPHLAGPVRPMAELPKTMRGESGRLWWVKKRLIDERVRSTFNQARDRYDKWIKRLNAGWKALRGDDGSYLVTDSDNLSAPDAHFDLYVARMVPELQIEDRLCSVDQLASGEIEWLALIGTLITTDFAGILLIDEPELHLHPEWQNRLLPSLRLVVPEAQIIMATHADPPWEQVYSFERWLLVPEDDPRAELLE